MALGSATLSDVLAEKPLRLSTLCTRSSALAVLSTVSVLENVSYLVLLPCAFVILLWVLLQYYGRIMSTQ